MKPIIYQLDPYDYRFPPVHCAVSNPDGLLAFGGDLCPQRLLEAYSQGIFPWFSEGEPIMWWSPQVRGVLYFDDFRINRSFRKFLKKTPYQLSVNQAFDQVIAYCSHVKRNGGGGTWITDQMIEAYIRLHRLGHAHSIEVWQDDVLVGGLYGVVVGGCFCGESMFHLRPYASKVAYRCLVELFRAAGGDFIDCQMQNDFLITLGVSEIPRELYLKQLASARQHELDKSTWQARILDAELYSKDEVRDD